MAKFTSTSNSWYRYYFLTYAKLAKSNETISKQVQFFQPQDHHYHLDILSACWNVQNQRNLMIQTWIIDQKPRIWAQFAKIWAKKIFFWNLGFVTFFDLLKTSFMQKIKEILRTSKGFVDMSVYRYFLGGGQIGQPVWLQGLPNNRHDNQKPLRWKYAFLLCF